MEKTETTTTIDINDISKLREVNRELRLLERKTKLNVEITVTGTFSIAKRWNAQTMKKEVFENGTSVNDVVAEKIGAKWITVMENGAETYLKLTDDATGTITLKSLAVA